MNEFNDLSSLMKNPDFVKMLQNVNMQQNLQEKPKVNNNNMNMMQMLSSMALNNNAQTNTDANNLLSLLPSLMGNNPNNISTMITLLNMILQAQNNKESQRTKNENTKNQN